MPQSLIWCISPKTDNVTIQITSNRKLLTGADSQNSFWACSLLFPYYIHIFGSESEFLFFQEFDTPIVLLDNPDGYLTELVNQTGPTMKKKLLQIAQKSGNVQATMGIHHNVEEL